MRALVLLVVLLPVIAVDADNSRYSDQRICAPFRGGVVDPAIVNSMLEAADEGRLYRIRPKQSEVGFCVDSTIGRVEARFEGIQGGLALRREVWGDASQMLVMIDANSLTMEDCFVRNMLKSEHFLDTATYPKILFVSSGIRWLDHENGMLEGMLTMHGVTRLVHFDVNMVMVPSARHDTVADIIVTAKSFINRADFDMDRLAFLVSDEVELCLRVEASLFKKH